MHRITYKEMSVNRPIVIRRGFPGVIESNSTVGYLGEWVVFKLPLSDTAFAEFRMPIEEALEDGLVIASSKIEYTKEDFEDME